MVELNGERNIYKLLVAQDSMDKVVKAVVKKFEERDKVREEVRKFKDKMNYAKIKEAKINAEIDSLKNQIKFLIYPYKQVSLFLIHAKKEQISR